MSDVVVKNCKIYNCSTGGIMESESQSVQELLGLVVVKIMTHPLDSKIKVVEIACQHKDPLRRKCLLNTRDDDAMDQAIERIKRFHKKDPEWNL